MFPDGPKLCVHVGMSWHKQKIMSGIFLNFNIANTGLLIELMNSFFYKISSCIQLMIIIIIIITVVIGIKYIIHVYVNIMKYAACYDCARRVSYIFRKLTPRTSKSCFQHS